MIENKIGCVLVTANRPDFYKKSFSSLINAVQDKNLGYPIEYVVVDDGLEKLGFYPINYIQTGGKRGVGFAKNRGIEFLLKNKCDHIFLIEDDIEIIHNEVFDHYIKTSKATGIKHLNYGLHGNHNRDANGNPIIRKTVEYSIENVKIDLYPNVLGAFSYYNKTVFDSIGLIDEEYFNALEHVDHTYKAFLKGFTTPFRWFADAHGSIKYLRDIVPDHEQSVIRNNEDFQTVFKNGLDVFIKKNGFSVVSGYGPSEKVFSQPDVLENMRNLYLKNHIT